MITIINQPDGTTYELYQKRNNESERIILKAIRPERKGTLAFTNVSDEEFEDILEEELEEDLEGFSDDLIGELGSGNLDDLDTLFNPTGEEDGEERSLISEWRKINDDRTEITDKYGAPLSSSKRNDDEDEDEESDYDAEDGEEGSLVKASGKLMEAISNFVRMSKYEVTPQGTMVTMKHKTVKKEVKDSDKKDIVYDFSRRTIVSMGEVRLKCNETGEIVKVFLDEKSQIKDIPMLDDGRYMSFERSELNKKDYVLYKEDGEKMVKEVEVKVLKTPLPEELNMFYKLNKNGEHIVNTTIIRNKLDVEPYKSVYDANIGFIDEDERKELFVQFLKKELQVRQVKEIVLQEVTSSAIAVKLKEKLEFGDRQLAQDLAVKVNEVVNLDREKSEILERGIVSIDSKPCSSTTYRTSKRQVFYEVTTLAGQLVSRRYIDNDNNVINIRYSDNFDTSINQKINYDRVYALIEKGGRSSNFNLSHLKVAHLPSISYFRSFLNLGYLDKMDAEIIDTPNKLYDMADEMAKLPADEVVGYDVETSGLKFFKQLGKDDHDVLATHSLSWKDWQSVIIPVRMKYCKNMPIEHINEVLKPILETREILAHNGQADVRFLIPDKIDLNLTEDTMVLIKHLIPFINKGGELGFRKALDDLVKAWRGYDMIDLQKYVFKPAGIEFDFTVLNEDYMIAYGCPDTMLMRMMYNVIRPKLGRVQEKAYKEHVKFTKNLAKYCTYPGIGVDVEAIEREKESALYVVNKVEKEIYRISNKTPETFNIASAPQKRNILFGYFGVPTREMILTDKGELPVDKNALKKIAKFENRVSSGIFEEDIQDTDGSVIVSKDELNKMKYPVARLLLIHSDLTKNISSYYNGMLNNTVQGVYNPQYKDGSTDTWRSTDRIQITKKGMKYNMCVYNSDYEFADADYAAEEFRLAVNASGDPVLIKMLQNPENDAHTGTAAKVFNVEPQYVVKAQRDAGKTCNFGIIYGMKEKTLSKRIAGKDIISQEELEWGTLCYTKYAAANKPIMKMIENNRKFVSDNGFFVNQLGGKMVYPQVIDVQDYRKKVFDENPDNMKDYMHSMGYGIVPKFDPVKRAENRGKLLTVSGNYPIQSWAAMVLMIAYNRLCAIIEREGLQGLITVPLHVHDEIGIIYHKSINPVKIIAILKEAMEYEFDMSYETTKLFIGVGFGKSWGECKADIRELPVDLQERLVNDLKEGKEVPLEYFGDDYGKAMQTILEDYMIERAYNMFKDMADKRHFIVSEMLEITNQDLFVPKKLGETFSIKTERFSKLNFVEERVCSDGKIRKVPNVKNYIKILAVHIGVPEESFTYEDGVFEDREIKDNSNLKDFLITSSIHENVLIGSRFIDVSITNLDRDKRKAMDNYLRQFAVEEPEGRQVRYAIGSRVKETDIFLMGLPDDAREDIQKIVDTGEVRYYEKLPNIGELPFKVNPEEKSFVIDAYMLYNHYGEKKYNDFLAEISKYQGKEYNIDFNNGQSTTRLNWGLSSISDDMVDSLLKIVRR